MLYLKTECSCFSGGWRSEASERGWKPDWTMASFAATDAASGVKLSFVFVFLWYCHDFWLIWTTAQMSQEKGKKKKKKKGWNKNARPPASVGPWRLCAPVWWKSIIALVIPTFTGGEVTSAQHLKQTTSAHQKRLVCFLYVFLLKGLGNME